MTPYHNKDNVTIYNAPALGLAQSLPDDSVDLIVCDWPYFKVKSDDWDNQWPTAAAFLDWMGEHLEEYRRILAPNGSYYGFASPQMAARVEVLTGEWFNVLNTITWAKPQFSTKAEMFDKDTMRAYFPASERIIFAEHTRQNKAGYGEVLKYHRKKAGLSCKELTFAIGAHGKVNHGGAVSNWESQYNWPSCQQWELLRGILPQLPLYKKVVRPFNAHKDAPYTDVWTFPTVSTYRGKHVCEKPLAMFRHIIEMSSKPGGVVFDPMCGSGGSAYAARNLGRVWIGGDTDARWCDATVKRLARDFDDWQPRAPQKEMSDLPLFNGEH